MLLLSEVQQGMWKYDYRFDKGDPWYLVAAEANIMSRVGVSGWMTPTILRYRLFAILNLHRQWQTTTRFDSWRGSYRIHLFEKFAKITVFLMKSVALQERHT